MPTSAEPPDQRTARRYVDPAPAWRPTGLVWTDAGAQADAGKSAAALAWLSPTGATRSSVLAVGARIALTIGADRRCAGLRWDGRRVPCIAQASTAPAARSGQCESCAAIARTRSVATDTLLDDPRPFHVYLAHHGSVVKAGITAARRGQVRLLEQGALSSVFLSAGSLVSARRCEALLTAALGLPQQVRTTRKRAARARPAPSSARAAELGAVTGRAAGLGWPPGQVWAPTEPVDHTPAYGLHDGGIVPALQLEPLSPGTTVSGRVTCRIGRDLYLTTPEGTVLVDTGLLQGWAMDRADDGAPFDAATSTVAAPEGPEHDVLF